jgi:diguanylate cyclase (GGDEF)-like protein
MLRGRPAKVTALVFLYGVSGLFSAVNAARPMHPDSPVALGWTLGAIGLAGAVAIWLRGARLSDVETHAALALAAGLVALLASESARAVGVVGLGPVIITIGLYAGWFLPLPAARTHVVVTLGLTSAGAVAADPSDFLVPWIVLAATTAVLTEIQGRLADQLRQVAATDPLTGLANRRAWETEAGRALSHAARTGEPVTIAILDLDAFKQVNDREGHGAGDALLRDVAARWTHELRQPDLLGRYGGDEFVLCLPDTDSEGALEITRRLRESHPFAWSAGLSTARDGDTLSSVLGRADADLYLKKRGGRKPEPEDPSAPGRAAVPS